MDYHDSPQQLIKQIMRRDLQWFILIHNVSQLITQVLLKSPNYLMCIEHFKITTVDDYLFC